MISQECIEDKVEITKNVSILIMVSAIDGIGEYGYRLGYQSHLIVNTMLQVCYRAKKKMVYDFYKGYSVF